MSQQSKRYLLMGLGLVVMVVLLGTAALGGVAGYVLANRAVGPVEQFRPVSNVITESGPQVVAASQNNQAEAQPAPLVVDESDSVAAVEAVLPAVVTVLNRQGNFGGGSGSGVFISDTGYVVALPLLLHQQIPIPISADSFAAPASFFWRGS